MPPWNDSSVILGSLHFAIGGVLLALVLLALEYCGRRQWAARAALGAGTLLLASGGICTIVGGPLDVSVPCGILGALAILVFAASTESLAAVGRAARRPAVLGGLLLTMSLGAAVYVRISSELDSEQVEVPPVAGAQYHVVPDLVAVTDLGQAVPLIAYDSAETLAQAERSFLSTGRFDQQIIRLAEPSTNCNCHGWVYTGGCYGIQCRYVNELLADNGYVEVTQPVANDLVIYRGTSGEVEHTGLVRHIGGDGLILVESKWGPLGVYLHPLKSQPYGTNHKFYRSPRAGHLVTVVPASSLPESRRPVLARTLNPTPAAAPSALPEQNPARREIYERPILGVLGQRKT